MAVYITGDTHGDFKRLKRFCKLMETTKDDVMIILGDSGINYYTDIRCRRYKHEIERLPITVFCIHGNHEERAELIRSYRKDTFWGGKVMVEDEFPNIKFALDGQVYKIPTSNGNKSALVIGGAYSVDKYYRLANGANWFSSEQPSDEIKFRVEKVLEAHDGNIDLILSHTCPYRYIPREWFLSSIDQKTVDNSTEIWLDTLLDKLKRYDKWYCGHYHGDKSIDKMVFMFNDIKQL